MTSFTTTTRIHQGFPFLCKLRIFHLNLAGMKFKHEKKNEKDSGRSSKMTSSCKRPIPNRAFSLTRIASMQIYGNQRKCYIRKEINSHRIGLEHQHGRRFIVWEHLYGRRDVMWKRSIVLCTLRVGKIWWGSVGK